MLIVDYRSSVTVDACSEEEYRDLSQKSISKDRRSNLPQRDTLQPLQRCVAMSYFQCNIPGPNHFNVLTNFQSMVSAQSCTAAGRGAMYSFGATTTFIVALMKVFVFVCVCFFSMQSHYKLQKNIANGICDVLTTEAVQLVIHTVSESQREAFRDDGEEPITKIYIR